MTKAIKVIAILMVMMINSKASDAQFNNRGAAASASNFGGGGPPGGSTPPSGAGVPFDGGLSLILLAAGAGLGAKKRKNLLVSKTL